MKKVMWAVLLPAFVFYALWPAFSVYQLNQGLRVGNAARVAGKIDFEGLRASLRPAFARRASVASADRSVEIAEGRRHIDPASLSGLNRVDRVEQGMAHVLSPDGLLRAYRSGRAIPDVIADAVTGDMQHSTGLAASNKRPTGAVDGAVRREVPISLANIKRLTLTGPASIEVAIAWDAASNRRDVTAELAFQGGDWRLVSLRLDEGN
ncbi:MAG: DUF2939 domain-containing protein [Hyphomicrobiaceae bacterium]|nr:DUF2939 domain-containing protein [Hyphomicrobiaceae bacterium]